MDFRFHELVLKELKNIFQEFDLLTLLGAQKTLINSEKSYLKEALLDGLKISVELHHAQKFVMVAHQDCGAYGGSKAFRDLEKEKEKYKKDLEEAEKIVLEKFPNLEVEKYIALVKDEKISLFRS
jgi:carbonic anhydrase